MGPVRTLRTRSLQLVRQNTVSTCKRTVSPSRAANLYTILINRSGRNVVLESKVEGRKTLKMLSRRIIRNFVTSAVRRSGHEPDGFPSANLPLSIKNRYTVTLIFVLFFGSGFSVPFLALRHQMLK